MRMARRMGFLALAACLLLVPAASFGAGFALFEHGARAVDEQGAQVRVAALGCPAELALEAAAGFFGCQPEPGGEVPPVAEGLHAAGGGNEGGGDQQPDARHRHQLLHGGPRFEEEERIGQSRIDS